MAAIGDENAVGFSLHFDPARLSFASVVLGSEARDSTLILNTNQVTDGKIGVLLAKVAGRAFPAGALELLDLNFVSGPAVGETDVTFADTPVLRQIGDPTANELTATFTDAVITIGSPAADDPTDGRAPSIVSITFDRDRSITITWKAREGGRYQFQYKNNLADESWKMVEQVTAGGQTASISDHIGTNSQKFYRVQLVE